MDVSQFREALSKLGWTKADFQQAAGVGNSTIYQWGYRNWFPPWVDHYLKTLLLLQHLHYDAVVAPREVRTKRVQRRKEQLREQRGPKRSYRSLNQELYREIRMKIWDEYRVRVRELKKKPPKSPPTPSQNPTP